MKPQHQWESVQRLPSESYLLDLAFDPVVSTSE